MKRGKKTRAWENARRRIKAHFENLGVTFCELRYDGCKLNSFLGFAHSKRRRLIVTKEELFEVCLACQNCHEILDRKPHAETERIVKQVIQNRSQEIW